MSDLLAALAATWPAAEVRCEAGWLLRRGAGGGSRVSAAVRRAAGADPAVAEAAMAGWGQVPLFQIRPGEADLDAALAARGYLRRDPTLILAAPAAVVAATGAVTGPDRSAILCAAPLAAGVEVWAEAGIGPARIAVMLRAPGPKVWLLGRAGDRVGGAGFVAVHDGVAMLHALEVREAARRQGLGARLTRTAAAWGLRAGAGTFALAVTAANAPARGLYAGLGLAEAARYHYRLFPRGESVR